MHNKPKLFLILTLLLGIAIGASSVWLFSRYKMRKYRHKAPIEKMFMQIDRWLDLDDKQEKEVRFIIEKYSEDGRQIRERYYEDIEALHDSVFGQIEPHLTEGQIEKFKARKHKHRKHHHKSRRHKDRH